MALEQAPSPPASICRKEGEAQHPRSQGRASSCGEASPEVQPERRGQIPPPWARGSLGWSPACGIFFPDP